MISRAAVAESLAYPNARPDGLPDPRTMTVVVPPHRVVLFPEPLYCHVWYLGLVNDIVVSHSSENLFVGVDEVENGLVDFLREEECAVQHVLHQQAQGLPMAALEEIVDVLGREVLLPFILVRFRRAGVRPRLEYGLACCPVNLLLQLIHELLGDEVPFSRVGAKLGKGDPSKHSFVFRISDAFADGIR